MSTSSNKPKRVKKPAKKRVAESLKKARGEPMREEEHLPLKGGSPQATVFGSYGLVKKIRLGRGFSPSELQEVKLSLAKARKIGLRVDIRRKSKHPENIKKLKDYYQAK